MARGADYKGPFQNNPQFGSVLDSARGNPGGGRSLFGPIQPNFSAPGIDQNKTYSGIGALGINVANQAFGGSNPQAQPPGSPFSAFAPEQAAKWNRVFNIPNMPAMGDSSQITEEDSRKLGIGGMRGI